MIMRLRAIAAVGAASAMLLAGCASTVAGSARPAVTYTGSSSTGTSTPPSSATSSATASASVTTSGSEIPPIPPSSATGASSTPPSSATVSSQTDATNGTIGGISVSKVLADLTGDNVALVNSSASVDALATAVAQARSGGLDLSVVSIGDKIDDTAAGDLADAVFAKVKGTVLVLTPSTITSRSDQLTSSQLKAANKAASGGKDDVDATQKYAASALGADTPTTSKATTSKTTSTAPTKDVVNGVDVAALATAAAKDGVVVQSGVTGVDRTQLVKLVASSKAKGLTLTIFILKDDVTGHLYDVADGVRKYSKDTVIGMSPTVYAISSGAYSNAQLQAAIDAAANATTFLEVAQDMTASLLSH